MLTALFLKSCDWIHLARPLPYWVFLLEQRDCMYGSEKLSNLWWAAFFHALIHRNLTVDLQGTTINHANVDALAQANSDERLCNLVEVSRTETVSHTDIEGIGRVNLRIIVDREGRNHDKVLALVRDSGMMITDRLGSMRVSRSQAMVAFPRSWHGFTAIVECLSKGERSLLREAEGPRHNEISPDNADETERGDVAKCLRELGSWVRSEIELLAKPPEPSRSDKRQ